MGERIACEQSERVGEWMSLSLDGLLDADGQRRMEQHLSACSSCRAQWDALQGVSALLSGAPMVGPSMGFSMRVERRLLEKANSRRRLFGGVAVLTGSLSLAGITVAVVALIVVGLLAWHGAGDLPTVQQGSSAVSQVASGVGLVGKGASLFLKDVLLRYGVPLLLVVGTVMAFLVGLWVWLVRKRPDHFHDNGYA